MNLGKVEIWETSLDRIVTLKRGRKGRLAPIDGRPRRSWGVGREARVYCPAVSETEGRELAVMEKRQNKANWSWC